ncbi:MAG: WD40/YVTN/BNR-like repeat-containing protein [Flavobacteriales bacterium]
MKIREFLIVLFLLPLVIFSQQEDLNIHGGWEAEGPFYGKLESGTYWHSMGLVNAIHVNPANTNIILMATNSSGIWKTKDRGVTWKCVTDANKLIPGMGARGFAVNPDKANEIYSGGGNYTYGFDTYDGSLLKSSNWGDSWELVQSFDTIYHDREVVAVDYSLKNKLFVIGDKEVFLSEDNGKSWESVFKIDVKNNYINSKDQQLCDFKTTPNGNLFVSSNQSWGVRGNCWRSTDEGKTWVNLEDTKEFEEVKKRGNACVKMGKSEEGKLILGYNDGRNIYLYKSNNQGESFYKTGSFKLDWETGDAKASKFDIKFSKLDDEKIYLGFIEFFHWDSINGLKQLSPSATISANEHDDVRTMEVVVIGGEEKVIMGNDGGVSMYSPLTNKFESLNGYNLPTSQVYNLAISQFDSNFMMYVGTQDNGTFKYQDGDWTWYTGGDGGGNWIGDNAHLKINSSNGIVMINEGKMKRYYSPNQQFTSWFIDFPIEVSRKDSILLYGSKRRNSSVSPRLFIQNSNKRSHRGVEVPGMRLIGEIAVSDNNPNLIFVAEGDHLDKNDNTPKLMKTVNKGESFIDLSNAIVYPSEFNAKEGVSRDTIELNEMLSYRTITDIEIDPFDDDIIYVSLSGVTYPQSWTKSWEYYRVLKSMDGGESWYDYSKGLPNTPIYCLVRDERYLSRIYCGGDEGVFVYSKKANFWVNHDLDFPKNVTVTDLKINYCQEKIYASTYGRGVYSYGAGRNAEIEFVKNHTIETYRFQKRPIVVKKGKTLTITSDIKMAPGTRIILEPKSKLIVDGGTISSGCNSQWKGVEIEEKKFLFFFKRKKGEVILKNGGKIE